MPTENRRTFIERKARIGFQENRSLKHDSTEAEFLVQYADTQLENVTRQRELLTALKAEGQLKS
jgi:hypothetical protein